MSGLDPDAVEKEVLERWEREQTFAESLRRRAASPRFSFYDGPPYATGSPHYGHILQTTIKDAVTRYWTMRGFLVERRVGWDCHGLPIENLVEKELGITNKKEIEERGVEAFNAACRQTVLRNVGEWTSLLRRVGRWADYTHAYATMDTPFMESAWWVFKTAWDRGLVYKGLRSSPYCPHCETPLSNFETSQGYRDVTDPAITIKVRLRDEEQTFLLVWTTTPWTLTANAAIAVNPDLRYVRARVGPETWIVAKDRVGEVISKEHVIESEFPGRDLVGKEYKPIYQFVDPRSFPRPRPDMFPAKPPEALKRPAAFRVVAAPFVSGTEGTGLVHIAPAFGEEDFRLADEEWLPLIQNVDASGRFTAEVTPWAGQFVKDADASIIRELETRGLLVRADTIRHSYPHCWRCHTPLLYMAVKSWFIAVSTIKKQLIENAKPISWVPDHLKEGRFGQGLRDAPDWAVSRTRYWGVPLPAWQCSACGEYTVVGSIQELEQLGGDLAALKSPHANPDLHRPYVDRVILTCVRCRGEAHRVPEVLDVWFDSGSMPYGQWHYPFENKELVESAFPADFIGEALEQTRGWFYTLHVLAGVLTIQDLGLGTNQPAFKNVVASGLVLAEDGRKLSKRFGNYIDPEGIVSKYGADTLRLYLLSSAKTGEDYRFSDRVVGDLYRRFTLILWNVWQYYQTYAGSKHEAVGSREEQHSLLDRWILARTARLVADVGAAMDAYQPDGAARALIPFVEDLSTWYVRRSRGREEALPVLREVLRTFSLVASPFIPFLAEHIHRELTGHSPHFEDWPDAETVGGKQETAGVLEQMRVVRELATAGLRARAEAKMKVRQPLTKIVFEGEFPELANAEDELLALLRDELNIKNVILKPTIAESARPHPPGGTLVPSGPLSGPDWIRVVDAASMRSTILSTTISEELRQEGIVRDLIRHVQNLRKRAAYAFDDVIVLFVVTDDAAVRAAVERFEALLRDETKSSDVRYARGVTDADASVKVGAAHVWLGVASSGPSRLGRAETDSGQS